MSYLQDLLGEAYKEGMTEEEISTALEAKQKEQEVPQKHDDGEMNKLKEMLSKANSEAANYKKQLQAKMSDDEKAKAEQKEVFDKLVADNEAMKKKLSITDNKAKLIGIGYPEELAQATAEAMFVGDMDTVMANQKAILDAREQAIRADVLKETPVPPAGQGSSGMTKAEFEALSMSDRMELYQKDPQLYSKLQSE